MKNSSIVFHSIRSASPVVGVVKSGCEIEGKYNVQGETRNAAKFHLESFI
jgi:hypothetical protein